MVDAYSIGNAMATRLVSCLLGFVLYLKCQVPASFRCTLQNAFRHVTENWISYWRPSTFSLHSWIPHLLPSPWLPHKQPMQVVLTTPRPGESTFGDYLGSSMSAARAFVMSEIDGVRVALQVSITRFGGPTYRGDAV